MLKQLIGTAAASLLLAHPAAATEIVQRPQSNVTISGAIMLTPSAGLAVPVGPDERPLWRLLAVGGDAETERRVAQLRLSYPEWRPSPRLLTILDDRRAEREFAAAKRNRDWAAIARIAAAHPDKVGCIRPDDAATALGPDARPGPLSEALAACATTVQRLALLGAVMDRHGPAAVASFAEAFDPAGLQPSDRAALRRLQQDASLRLLARHLQTGSAHGNAAGLARGAALASTIEDRRDAGLAMALGWAAMHDKRPAEAASWFTAARRYDPTQSIEGLARAHLALGALAAAMRDVQGDTTASDSLLRDIAAARMALALRSGDDRTIVALAAAQVDPPAALGWSLLRLNQPAAAAAAFERRYARHPEPAVAAGLMLSLAAQDRFADAATAAARLGGPARAAFDPASPAGYRLHLAWLRSALAAKDMDTAARLSQALTEPAKARGDAETALALGWSAMARNQASAAAPWFARAAATAWDTAAIDDARYGGALAAYTMGDGVLASSVALLASRTERWQRLHADALMLQARQAGDDPMAANLAQQALAVDPNRRDASLMLAWSAQHAGRTTEAAVAFETLYRAQPDEAAATGLAVAAPATRLQELANTLGGPLVAAARHHRAMDAYARKDFLTAFQTDPAAYPALENIGATIFGVSTTGRTKSGSAGTSQLRAASHDLYGSVSNGGSVSSVRIHLISLDAGASPGGRLTTRLPVGAEPSASWRMAGAVSPFVEVGTTPIGGALAPTVQGRAGVGITQDGLSLRTSVYRESVTESVLSYTGVTDRVTGHRYGRVTETGARLETFVSLADRWGLYAAGSVGVRSGLDVQSNIHLQATAALSYDLKVPGIDSLTVGPSYRYARFDHDLSGFSPGQGGYYSPASSRAIGASLRILTAEARDFAILGSAFAGYQFARSSGTADALGGRGAGSRQDGFTAAGQVAASYQISERWVFGGMVRTQISPQYRDAYFGLALTYSFGARPALFSADLPQFDER